MGEVATVEAQEAQADFLFLRQVGQGVNLRVSEPLDVPNAEKGNNLLCVSNSAGLLFAATKDGFVVQKLDEVRKQFSSANRNQTPTLVAQHSISTRTNDELGERVTFLRVADQESKLVVGLANARIAVWDVKAFLDGDAKHSLVLQPPSSDLTLVEVAPNPSDRPELVATLFSSTSDVHVRKAKLAMFDVRSGQWQGELNIHGGACATCVCWSVRGKQIVVGLDNGELAQLTPEGQEKERIARANDLQGDHYVENVVWLENHVFLVTYNQPATEDDTPEHQYEVYALLRDTSSGNNEITAVRFNDPTPPFGDTSRYGQRYVSRLRQWKPMKHMLFVANTSSTDVGLLGCSSEESGPSAWQTLELEDTSRPALPFSSIDKSSDTSPVGLDFDITAQENVDDPQAAARGEDGKGKMPAVPILLIYINDGLLLAYHVINTHQSAGPYQHMAHSTNAVSVDSSVPTSIASPQATSPVATASKPSVTPAFGQSSAFGGNSSSSTSAFGQPSAFGFGSSSSTPAFGQSGQIGQKAASPFATAGATQSSSGTGGGFGSFAAKAAPSSFGSLGNPSTFSFSDNSKPADSKPDDNPFANTGASSTGFGGLKGSSSFGFGNSTSTIAGTDKPAFGFPSAFGTPAKAAENTSSSPFATNASAFGKPAFGQSSSFGFGASTSNTASVNAEKKEEADKSTSPAFGAFAAKANTGFGSFGNLGQKSTFSFGDTSAALSGLDDEEKGSIKAENAEKPSDDAKEKGDKPAASAFGAFAKETEAAKSVFSFGDASASLPGIDEKKADQTAQAVDTVRGGQPEEKKEPSKATNAFGAFAQKATTSGFGSLGGGQSSTFSFGNADAAPAPATDTVTAAPKGASEEKRQSFGALAQKGDAASSTEQAQKPTFSFSNTAASLPDAVKSEDGKEKAANDDAGLEPTGEKSDVKDKITDAKQLDISDLSTNAPSAPKVESDGVKPGASQEDETAKTNDSKTEPVLPVSKPADVVKPEAAKSAFSFGNPSLSTDRPAVKATSSFSFGQTPSKQVDSVDQSKTAFSFGPAPSKAATEQSNLAFSFAPAPFKPVEPVGQPKSTFSFGSASQNQSKPEVQSRQLSFGNNSAEQGSTGGQKEQAATTADAQIGTAESDRKDEEPSPPKNMLGGLNKFDFSGLTVQKSQQSSQAVPDDKKVNGAGDKTLNVSSPFLQSKLTQTTTSIPASTQTSKPFSFHASTQIPEPSPTPIKNLMDARESFGAPQSATSPQFGGFRSPAPATAGAPRFSDRVQPSPSALRSESKDARPPEPAYEKLQAPPKLSMSAAAESKERLAQGHGLQEAFLEAYMTMERELELLRKNVDHCAVFQAKLREPKSNLANFEGLDKPDYWTFGELDNKQKLTEKLQSDVRQMTENSMTAKAQLRELQSEQLKVESKREEIVRFLRARQDPTLSKTVKVRQLGPVHSDNQRQLRKSHNALHAGLTELGGQLDRLRKKTLDVHNGTPAQLQVPSLETIRRTMRNITDSAEAKLLDLEELELTLTSMFNIRSDNDVPSSLKRFDSMTFDDRSRELLADESGFPNLTTLEQDLPAAFDAPDSRVKDAHAHQRNARKLQEMFCKARKQPVLTVKKTVRSSADQSRVFRASDLQMTFAKGPIHIDDVVKREATATQTGHANVKEVEKHQTMQAANPTKPSTNADNSLNFSPSSKIPGAFVAAGSEGGKIDFGGSSASTNKFSGSFGNTAFAPNLNFGATLPSTAFDLPPESAPFRPGSGVNSSSGGRGIHSQKSSGKRNAAVALPSTSPTNIGTFGSSTIKSDFFSSPSGNVTTSTGQSPTTKSVPQPLSFSFTTGAPASSSPKHSFSTVPSTAQSKEPSTSTQPAEQEKPTSPINSFSFNAPTRGPYVGGVGSAFTTFKGPQFLKPSVSSPLAKAAEHGSIDTDDDGVDEEGDYEDEDNEDDEEEEEEEDDEYDHEEADEDEDDAEYEDEEEGLSAVEEEDDGDDNEEDG